MPSKHSKPVRALLIIVAIASVVAALDMGHTWLSSTAPATTEANIRTAAQDEESTKAPDFEREAMDGSMVRLSSYRGRVVVVNFWATWCTPCRVEIPEFIKMQEELDGAQFIGVSLDEEGFDVVLAP